MKTKQKILKLMEYGIKPTTLGTLNEGQINALYSRLSEQVTPLPAKPSYKIGDKGGVVPANDKGYSIKKNTDNTVTATPMEEEDTLNVVNDPDATEDGMGMFEEKELQEKFESKKQQKYFFSKCGDGKTKEQKKWCKMADEFAKKTNFKKLPNKKETKEGYMDMIGKAMNKNMGNKISDIKPSLKWESELEKNITRLLENNMNPKMTKKDFLKLVSEQGTKEKEKTKEKERTTTKPSTPYSPKPGPAKAPKAETKEGTETAPVKPKEKEKTRTKPSTPYSPKPGPAKAPKAGKENVPNWLSFKSIGIKLK